MRDTAQSARAPTTKGPELFFRYAQPPNVLGYCGPDEHDSVVSVAGGLTLPREEATQLALAFQGAWPYLELIGNLTRRSELSRDVVEAYWIGNQLLDRIGLLPWGNSVSERFRKQAESRWGSVEQGLNAGGLPNHAFHVFCVYPWVGLLREGFVGPSLEVLDRCRISWGTVEETAGDHVRVRRQPLIWQDERLIPGQARVELYRADPRDKLSAGEIVSLHWEYVCERIDRQQLTWLTNMHDRHLAIANNELRLGRLEPVR